MDYTLFLPLIFLVLQRTQLLLTLFQQEEYDLVRALQRGCLPPFRWIDKSITATLISGLAVAQNPSLTLILLTLLLLFHPHPIKRTLRWTPRVVRLVFGMSILTLWAIRLLPHVWLLYTLAHLPLLTLTISHLLLLPIEWWIQRMYICEAEKKWANFQGVSIAITGSFGKTSTKNILAHLLGTKMQIAVTPSSVNTIMGLTRFIRESLPTKTECAILEVGAYGPGSIQRVGQHFPYQYGMLTAIGHAHYERFKTLETVAQAKWEIALPAERVVVASQAFALCPPTLRSRCIVVGEEPHCDWRLLAVETTKNGSTFQLTDGSRTLHLMTPLLGSTQVKNCALAAVMALELGVSATTLQQRLATCPPIPHRQAYQKGPKGAVWIDDSYNGNLIGMQDALETLHRCVPTGTRYIITPGLTEMGALQQKMHHDLAHAIGIHANVAVITAPHRVPELLQALETTPCSICTFESTQQALQWVGKRITSEDGVLVANDLLDIDELQFTL